MTTEKSRLEEEVNEFKSLETGYNDAVTLFELAQEEADDSALAEVSPMIATLSSQFERAEFRKMLSEDVDPKNAIVTKNHQLL